jgi:flagella basal body P-ring formation protein FlgA
MRAFIRIFLAIILLLGAVTFSVSAGVQGRIEHVCRKYVLAQTHWDPDDVEIEFRRYIRPKINWSGVDFQVDHPGNADLCGMVTLQVTVLKNGQELRRFPVPVDITLYDEVVVTKRRLRRKDVLSPADVILERREIDVGHDRPLRQPEDVVGFRAARSLTAGAIVAQSALEENPLILRGEKVTIRYQSGRLLLTALGEAIEDGWEGRPVRVKNLSSKKLITGVPVGDGVVNVLYPQ